MSRADLQMRSPIVPAFVAHLRRVGCETGPLLARFGLPPEIESRPEAVLPLTRLHALLDAAESLSGDAWLGLHVAQGFERGRFGILEFAGEVSPTVAEGLQRMARLIALFNEYVVIAFERDGEGGRLEQSIPGHPACVGRHGNEFFVAATLLQLRLQTGQPVAPQRVWFAHAAPASPEPLFALLGTEEVAFGREANGFQLAPAQLDLPFLRSDPALLAFLDQQSQRALEEANAPNRFLGRVRQQIRGQLRRGAPTLEATAKGLELPVRTLQRRLAAEQASFQGLVDGVREELARLLLANPQLPVESIAERLGYAESSTFLRAFKRWTGTTPSALRRG